MKIEILIHSLQNRVALPYHCFQTCLLAQSFSQKKHNYIIGFVTKIINSRSDLCQVNGLSQYGTLMRIHQSQNSLIHGKTQSNCYSIKGLTFARFKVLSLKQYQYGNLAEIQVLNDEISLESQMQIQKSIEVEQFKNRLSTFYFQSLNQFEALKQIKTIKTTNIKKLVHITASKLDLSIDQSLRFLQLNNFTDRIQMLTDIIIKKTYNLIQKVSRQTEDNNIQPEIIPVNQVGIDQNGEEFTYTYKNKTHYLSIKGLDPSFKEAYAHKRLPLRAKL